VLKEVQYIVVKKYVLTGYNVLFVTILFVLVMYVRIIVTILILRVHELPMVTVGGSCAPHIISSVYSVFMRMLIGNQETESQQANVVCIYTLYTLTSMVRMRVGNMRFAFMFSFSP